MNGFGKLSEETDVGVNRFGIVTLLQTTEGYEVVVTSGEKGTKVLHEHEQSTAPFSSKASPEAASCKLFPLRLIR